MTWNAPFKKNKVLMKKKNQNDKLQNLINRLKIKIINVNIKYCTIKGHRSG